MRRAAMAVAVVGMLGAIAAADSKNKDDDVGDDPPKEGGTGEAPEQLVLMNASSKPGTLGRLDRISRVLGSRGMLKKLPERLAAALDGRNVLLADLDKIKDAYGRFDPGSALKLIDADEKRILDSVAAGDPVPALAQLSEWRGLIAAQNNQDDEAVRWFRAAYRLNPSWVPEPGLRNSPQVKPLVERAREEATVKGKLRIAADPQDATFVIDGKDKYSGGDKIELPIGIHLVVLSAKGRAPYAELVEINAGKIKKLEISLDKESQTDKAARLIEETVAAPSGQARLKSAAKLAKITGPHILVVEDGGDDHIVVRIYDVDAQKVSKKMTLTGDETSAKIAEIVASALQADNMIDAGNIVVVGHTEKKWYERWYVWAAVGAVAIGSFAGYEYMTRAPTSVRGF
jgi:hypothetical protein